MKLLKITQSTRFWFAIIAFIINTVVFSIAIMNGVDPTSVGTGLALVDAPLFAYIFGATVRPSGAGRGVIKVDDKKETKDENIQ